MHGMNGALRLKTELINIHHSSEVAIGALSETTTAVVTAATNACSLTVPVLGVILSHKLSTGMFTWKNGTSQ